MINSEILDKGVVIGSTALNLIYEDFNRYPKDLDIAVSERMPNEVVNGTKVEFLYNPILVNYVANNTEDGLATPDILVTLKASHLFWDRNWAKHMYDTQFLLKKGAKIIEHLFYKLYEFWQTELGPNKRSDLTLDKEEFFDNAINPKMEVEHDVMHTFINPTPTYTKLLAEGKTVELDSEKFSLLTEEEKDALAIEEVMVMAYERYKKFGYKAAYYMMMQKFIMGHAPMYLALHIINNYLRLHVTNVNFIEIIDKGIEEFKNKKKENIMLTNGVESLTVKELNSLLSNLNVYTQHKPSFVKILDRVNRDDDYESPWEEVHKTSNPNLFLIIKKATDSYGENEQILGIRFGKAVTKTITVYDYE